MLELRDLEPDDDLDAFHAGSANWVGAQFWRDRAASIPADMPMLHVGALMDGQPAGAVFAVAAPAKREGRGFGTGGVLPDLRRRGVGTALRDRLLAELSGWSVPGVVLAAADEPLVHEVLRRWGVPVTGRHYTSELDLAALDDAAVSAAVGRAAAGGVDLAPFGDGEELDDAGRARLEALYPWICDRMREAPDSLGAVEDMPYSVFESLVGAPWRLVLATRQGQGQLAGFTGVAPLSADTVNTFFTGVHPDERGHGVGLALKARHAQLLRERGVRRIVTQNMDMNAAILRSNDRLGFVRTDAYLDAEFDAVSPA